MAEIVKTVRIETGNGERSVKSLKKEISDLRDALLNMDKGGEDWKKTAAELTKAQEDLNSVMRAGKEAADADASSIAGMEAQYKSLYQTYRLLSDEQRKTAEGMSMQKQLAELSKNLNATKKDAGNFKDNIGHYADDIMGAFSKMSVSVGGMQVPIANLGKGFKNFGSIAKGALDVISKHPFMTIAVVLIGLFKKIGDAIKGNEELQMRMNKVMAAFKPIGDVMAQVLDRIASIAVSVAEGIAKVVTWVNNLFSATKKLSDAEQDLAQQENELIKQRREYNEQNAEDEARIANLQEQASLTDDIREKEKLLTEAKQLQEKVNERNVALAQKEYDIIKKKNELTPTSTADLDKESQALIKLNNAREEGDKKLKKLNTSLKSASAAGAKAADDAKKQLDEILKRFEENSKTEEQKLKEKFEEEKKILIKYHKDTTKLEEEYQKNLQKLEYSRQAARRKNQEEYENLILDYFIKPSTSAFDFAEKYAEKKLENIAKDVEEKFGDHPTSESLFDNGQLTAAAEYFNEVYGTAINTAMTFSEAWERITIVQDAYGRSLDNIRDEQKKWKIELAETEKELEVLRTTYQMNASADTFFSEGNLFAYTQALAVTERAERDFLQERADTLKVEYEKIANWNETQLNAYGLTLNDRLEMEREYYEALEELRQHDYENYMMHQERKNELAEQERESIFENIAAQNDAMNSIIDTYRTLLDAYKRDGEMSEKEAKRKANTLKWLEGIQTAVAVSQIIADTASGWMQLNKSQAAEYVINAETAAATGPAAAATKAALDAKTTLVHTIRKATLITNGVAAAAAAIGKGVAAIKGLDKGSDDGGGAGSASAAPQLIDSTPYSYTRELQTDVEREELLNTPIYVRVTDIDEAQEKVRKTAAVTTF